MYEEADKRDDRLLQVYLKVAKFEINLFFLYFVHVTSLSVSSYFLSFHTFVLLRAREQYNNVEVESIR